MKLSRFEFLVLLNWALIPQNWGDCLFRLCTSDENCCDTGDANICTNYGFRPNNPQVGFCLYSDTKDSGLEVKCLTAGESCAVDGNCCEGLDCSDYAEPIGDSRTPIGKCNVRCRRLGESCNSDADCCGKMDCFNNHLEHNSTAGVCRTQCKNWTESCESDDDCCDGYCNDSEPRVCI